MRLLLINAGLFITLLLSLSSCDLFCDCEAPATPCLFAYDQLIYTPNGAPGGQVVAPDFEGDQSSGTFSAQPEGLAIDSVSGIIDVNASAEGEYTVTYTLDDGGTACETKVGIEAGEPTATECALEYSEDGSNTFFASENNPQLIRPVGELEDPSNFSGRFTVWPQGLDIDPITGVIDVNVSEPGLTYQVTFTSEDGLTACTTEVTIGGLDYRDVILDFDGTIGEAFVEENPSVEDFIVIDSIIEPAFNFQADDLGGEIVSADEELVFAQEGRPFASVDAKATLRNIGEIEPGFFQEFAFAYEYSTPLGERIRSQAEVSIYYYLAAEEVPSSLLALLGRKERAPENGRSMHRHGIVIAIGAL